MVSEQDIYDRLMQELPDLRQAIITDSSAGCGQSFEVVVVSDYFYDKNKIQRSRAINNILQAEIAAMHAFSVKCYTSEEFSKLTV